MAGSEFRGSARPLQPGDIEWVAADLGWESAMVHAVLEVEAAGGGFLSDGRPKILFERHIFWRQTGGRFGVSGISASTPGGYGRAGANQYTRLAAAIRLDREAALKSASWGGFQIMGFNHAVCGFADVESFVKAMMTGERAHLDAFAAFCRGNGIARLLQGSKPDFAGFARRYNGPAYARNSYDTKLAAAYRKWREKAPDPGSVNAELDALADVIYDVLRVQERLRKLGYYKRALDGAGGKYTSEAAMAAYVRFLALGGTLERVAGR